MDNITHSLFGATVSESLWALLPEQKKTQLAPRTRRAMLLTSVLANNFPDLDFFYASQLYSEPRISSLLHHRGHTHTFAIAFLESLLILGLLAFGQFVLKKWHFKKEWRLLTFLAFLGVQTHILLDSINQYGVHPFWPFDNSWVFGDLFFILEPWAWVTFSLFLWSVTQTKLLRRAYLVIAFLGLVLSFFTGTGLTPLPLALLVWALALWAIFRFSDLRLRVLVEACSVTVMIGSFFLARNTLASLTPFEIEASSPNASLHDVILSPLPVNPFCWSLLTVETEKDALRIRRGLAAPFPGLVSVRACQFMQLFSAEQNVEPSGEHFVWQRFEEISITELKDLEARFCDVKEFLKFARAPYFWKADGGIFLSDLRFERAGKQGLATFRIRDLSPPCPNSRAPWRPPISSLLQ